MLQHEIQNWTPTNPTKGRLYDPFEHARELGVDIIYRDLQTANEMWLPHFNTVVLKRSMRETCARIACAHGVAHAILGHMDDRPKHEVQADRYAADWLINYDELCDMLQWTNDLPRIAHELGVTGRLLRVYLNVHRLAG